MANKPTETKKPFFSCCAAEEDKKEALVDISQKKLPSQVYPPSTYNESKPSSVISNGQPPKVRFSYNAPSQENKVLGFTSDKKY